MTLKVYEVEMAPHVEGQRFCQHIKAESAADAGTKVHAIQGREIIAITIYRECTQAELDQYEASKVPAPVATFNPEDWKEP